MHSQCTANALPTHSQSQSRPLWLFPSQSPSQFGVQPRNLRYFPDKSPMNLRNSALHCLMAGPKPVRHLSHWGYGTAEPCASHSPNSLEQPRPWLAEILIEATHWAVLANTDKPPDQQGCVGMTSQVFVPVFKIIWWATPVLVTVGVLADPIPFNGEFLLNRRTCVETFYPPDNVSTSTS